MSATTTYTCNRCNKTAQGGPENAPLPEGWDWYVTDDDDAPARHICAGCWAEFNRLCLDNNFPMEWVLGGIGDNDGIGKG